MATGAKTGSAKRALQRLRSPSPASGGLESAGGSGPDLTDARIRDSLTAARERFNEIAQRAKEGRDELTREQARVLADAEAALKKLATEGDAAAIDDRQMAGLEAVIVPDGTRPSLFVQGDDVDPTVKEAGAWQGDISGLRTGIGKVALSVGRINSALGGPNYAGTGFVVAEGLVATNRHVLEFLVGGSQPGPGGSWAFKKPVSIDFAAEFGSGRQRSFKITGVAYAGPDPINDQVDLSHLDLATRRHLEATPARASSSFSSRAAPWSACILGVTPGRRTTRTRLLASRACSPSMQRGSRADAAPLSGHGDRHPTPPSWRS